MGDVAVGRHHAVRLAAVNGQELNEEHAFKFLRLAPLKPFTCVWATTIEIL